MRERIIQAWVGLFMLIGVLALLILAIKVSGLSNAIGNNGYNITASFVNVGGLKARSPVTLAGVRIGEVSQIKLDPHQFQAIVTMKIDSSYQQLPIDTSARILTQGLLGANYISLSPGVDQETFLKKDSIIQDTQPALILEELIGQLVFSLKNTRGK